MMQFGNLSTKTTKNNTELFAREVMPKLKSLFSEWDNRWWPKPLTHAQRAPASAFVPATAAE
jgi:hypothetical protein